MSNINLAKIISNKSVPIIQINNIYEEKFTYPINSAGFGLHLFFENVFNYTLLSFGTIDNNNNGINISTLKKDNAYGFYINKLKLNNDSLNGHESIIPSESNKLEFNYLTDYFKDNISNTYEADKKELDYALSNFKNKKNGDNKKYKALFTNIYLDFGKKQDSEEKIVYDIINTDLQEEELELIEMTDNQLKTLEGLLDFPNIVSNAYNKEGLINSFRTYYSFIKKSENDFRLMIYNYSNQGLMPFSMITFIRMQEKKRGKSLNFLLNNSIRISKENSSNILRDAISNNLEEITKLIEQKIPKIQSNLKILNNY